MKIHMKIILSSLFLLGLNSYSQINVNSNASLIIGTNSTLISQDDVTVNNNGTLKFNGSGTLILKNGDFTMNGNFTPDLSTVIFYDSVLSDHYLTCSNNTNNTFYNLTITGSISSMYDLHLMSDINVSNELTVSSRKLNLDNHGIDLLTTGSLINESNDNRVYDSNYGTGWIKRTSTINSNTTINPGNLGLTITTHNNQMGNTIIKRLHYRDDIGGNPSIYKIFDVTPQYNGTNYGGNLNVDLQFKYFPSDVGGDISASENSLVLFRSGDNGNTWELKGGTIDVTNKILTYNGFTQFSQITLAPMSEPLPVELKSFMGNCDKLTWETVSELNNKFFTIEYSVDANNWEVINIINGYGTTNYPKTYTYTSNIKNGYYRLSQTDFDGFTKKFNIIYVGCKEINNESITSYPNPIKNNLNIVVSSSIISSNLLTVTDIKGSIILSEIVKLNNGYTNININSENWASGVYLIKLSNGSLNYKTLKIIKD